ALEDIEVQSYIDKCIKIDSPTRSTKAIEIARELKPWRKGPFELFGECIESEWRSYVKFDILKSHIDAKDKDILDIGCNNGYYMFRLSQMLPRSLTGIDPSPKFFLQFMLMERYLQTGANFYPIGIDDIHRLEKQYDTIICLGILYHRHNPIEQLKNLKNYLKKGGQLVVDNLIIEHRDEMVLSPSRSYAKMKNCYFIPSMSAFRGWLERAGYEDIEIIGTRKTDVFEQRKTEWIDGESLDSFLDPHDDNQTIEGYPAPIRGYIKARSN
ncbi:MAG: tRNA 5-methoxyuridine(34)/uridine 5-oxyacetic acid(34) synthase CmoB, partial [Campylobacterales bacterium]